ncbi:hypothetical protein TNIN_245791 [Trichonephila inaurata madagascariensis]|uniref:Uncharacterized protein n=1 Tax=Trichonephila inaurata madagascariensis TaxID=2747483 RepID=A0A8X7C3V2_9ARAC|nr:hypothetical protein TNIN_245791 [Trichonephila inaurata madagascariensis]
MEITFGALPYEFILLVLDFIRSVIASMYWDATISVRWGDSWTLPITKRAGVRKSFLQRAILFILPFEEVLRSFVDDSSDCVSVRTSYWRPCLH